jgi:hypothetical protein
LTRGRVLEDLCGHGLLALFELELEVVIDVRVFWREQCCGFALFACTSCAPDAMCIVLDVLWAVIVDDMLYATHVDAAPSHVGADEDIVLALFELIERCLPPVLSFASVEHGCFETLGLQVAIDHVTALACIHEDHDGRLFARAQLIQPRLLLRLGTESEHLLYRRRRLPDLADGHKRWTPEILRRERERERERKREERGSE